MNQMLINLNKILKNNPLISNICDHYGYIKIDTTCPIKYSNEFLTLYAKPSDKSVLVTDLNLTLEDAYNCNISNDLFKTCVEKNNLSFDESCVFSIVTFEKISEVIENFINLIQDLNI